MAAKAKFKELLNERKNTCTLIERLDTQSRAPEANFWNEAVIDMQKSALERHWALFQTKQLAIVGHPTITELGRSRNEATAIEVANVYYTTKQRLSALMSIVNPNHNRPLPKATEIMLSKFSGNYTGWTSWRAQFVSKVLETDLPPDSKIDLLMSALEGEARKCAGETEHRDRDDLNRIWKKLEDTYDNPYQIVTAHIYSILDIPEMEFGQSDVLRAIIDTIEQELRSLNRFDCNTEAWSPLIAVYVLRKLDKSTRAAWEMDRDPVAPPALKELLPFLERRILAMRNLKANNPTPQNCHGSQQNNRNSGNNRNDNKRQASDSYDNRPKRPKSGSEPSSSHQSANPFTPKKNGDACAFCNGSHRTWNCEKLAKIEFNERLNKIKGLKLCDACLSNQHSTSTCTWKGCKACDNAKHNRMNCPKYPVMRVSHTRTANRSNNSGSRKGNNNHSQVMTVAQTPALSPNGEVVGDNELLNDGLPIIGTALCQLNQVSGTISGEVRALCDSGSQINLITQECVQKWNLERKPCKIGIVGVGDSLPMTSLGMVDCSLRHRFKISTAITVRFVIVNKISGINPQKTFNCPLTAQLCSDELADPTFTIPGPIDALIGVSTWTSIIYDDIIRSYSLEDRFIAQDSMLGWVVSGYAKQSQPLTAFSFHISSTGLELDKQLERFWSIDDCENYSVRTSDEQRAEDIFSATHTRDEDGRYVVMIPLKENVIPLGRSRQTAFNRFVGLENRLKKNAEMAAVYKEFMLDYINTGHLIPAPPAPMDPSKSYYIPYHIISKKKFRVVFDASCITSSGVSFNDHQLAGEKLQADLYKTLLLFRTFRFALTADIIKMFRQVKVHTDHWNFQRIFFRLADDQPIGEYIITRVIWGFTSAGFNAVRALRQCALDEANKFPIASAATLANFYIDDFLSGAESVEELQVLYAQMIDMLKTAGFELSKWATSHTEFAKTLKENEEREIVLQPESGVLGMSWDPNSDNFYIKVRDYPAKNDKPFTKRQIISRIAQVYDPTGLYAPVIIAGKIIIQEIWKLNLKWDDDVPNNIISLWQSFHQSVMELTQIPVPRWIAFSRTAQSQLHLFSDASKMAYGTCAYLRTAHPDGSIFVRLITSRNKVAPIKLQTIPRLELMGAEMSIGLCKLVRESCDLQNVTVHFWVDSTIVLHWLKKNPQAIKPFVANRVSTILAASKIEDWRHVPGEQNPADLLSRGCSSAQLKDCRLWWNGPDWLQYEPDHWPNTTQLTLSLEESNADEIESSTGLLSAHANTISDFRLTALAIGNGQSLIERASTLNKLVRVTAFIIRYGRVLRVKKEDRCLAKHPASFEDVTTVSPAERDDAIKYWARLSQNELFSVEWKALQDKKEVPSSSKLVQLCPFIDQEGIVRVGGRLAKSNLPLDVKHQIILHPESMLCKLVIADAHARAFHGGAQLTMAIIRQKFWVPNLRIAVKKVIKKCVICIRFSKDMAKQLMGSLPPARTNQTFPFAAAGVDFAGPFEIRKTHAPQMNLRQAATKTYKPPTTTKCWIVVFVCMKTRAVHLDLAHGLHVEAFLEVFARFTSRRGQCNQLWSDNGTNFIGSNKELQRVRKEWQNKFPHQELANLGTTWRFNSPAAPHQGGLWEAGVKAMKYHLRRIMGSRILSANQLYTVLTQIECCLNSRPLSPLTDDPNDLETLTPGHFLVGRSLLQHPPSENLMDCNDNRLTLWGQQQKLTQSFWRRWKDDFLLSLQKRNKWYRTEKNIKPGDMVIVLEENRPPTLWPIGRIESVFPGPDGLVRNVSVKTAAGSKVRPIQKLCLLPINDEVHQSPNPQ